MQQRNLSALAEPRAALEHLTTMLNITDLETLLCKDEWPGGPRAAFPKLETYKRKELRRYDKETGAEGYSLTLEALCLSWMLQLRLCYLPESEHKEQGHSSCLALLQEMLSLQSFNSFDPIAQHEILEAVAVYNGQLLEDVELLSLGKLAGESLKQARMRHNFAATATRTASNMIDVVIIGAGISGISCAKHLHASDRSGQLRIKIVEAAPRAGGRAKTLEQNGSTIELGASWVHGEKGNAIYDYASTKDLLLPDSWMSDPDWRWEDRPLRHMCGLEASDAEKKVFAEVEQAFDAFLDKASLMDEPGEKSLGNLLDEKFHEWAKRKEHDARMMQAAFEFKKREFISGIGSLDLYTASLAGYVQAEDVGPECVPLRRGYSSIVQALLQEIPDSEIVYGSGVKEVKNRDDHVEVFLESGSAIVARAAVHTHPTYFGTAHGAYESGARCASEVMQTLEKPAP
eukprot:g2988.t1